MRIVLGSQGRWGDVRIGVKGVSSTPGSTYAKLRITAGGEPAKVTLRLGESETVENLLNVRLDEVSTPERSSDEPTPTGSGHILVTVSAADRSGEMS